MRLVIVGGIVGAIAAVTVAAISTVAVLAGPGEPPVPTPVPPGLDVRMPVQLGATAGPVISQEKAIETANRLAQGPITRQAVGLVKYEAAAAWMGSYTYTIDANRDMYLIVNQATLVGRRGLKPVTCNWYYALVDATSGRVTSYGCTDRTTTWPATLPTGVVTFP